MVRVEIVKVCVNEKNNKICANQGTDKCYKCAVMAGQRFKGHTTRKVYFDERPMSALIRTVLYGGDNK